MGGNSNGSQSPCSSCRQSSGILSPATMHHVSQTDKVTSGKDAQNLEVIGKDQEILRESGSHTTSFMILDARMKKSSTCCFCNGHTNRGRVGSRHSECAVKLLSQMLLKHKLRLPVCRCCQRCGLCLCLPRCLCMRPRLPHDVDGGSGRTLCSNSSCDSAEHCIDSMHPA